MVQQVSILSPDPVISRPALHEYLNCFTKNTGMYVPYLTIHSQRVPLAAIACMLEMAHANDTAIALAKGETSLS